MDPLEALVEARIREAIDAGAFAGNPCSGQPLPPDDLERVPRELRMAYKLLRDAGYVPEELQLRQANLRLQDLLAALEDGPERRELARTLSLNQLRFELLMERRGRTRASGAYGPAIRRRLGFR
jgi:hypothetical protein